MTVQDLRDVLRDHADGPPPANPARLAQVRARVRATRRRRRITAGVAVAAALAAGVALLPGLAAPDRSTSAATAGPALPETFTAPDGTAYRRLALTSIGRTGGQKKTVTVPVTGRPLDVAVVCDGEGLVNNTPMVYVGGRWSVSARLGACSRRMELLPLEVSRRDGQVSVTFDATRHGVCGPGMDCGKPAPAAWTLAVYEWTPPAEPVEPGPVKDFPARFEGWKLAGSATGVWPRDDVVRLEIEGTGRKVALDQLCAGDLARRMWFTFQVGGRTPAGRTSCGVWESGAYPAALMEVEVPEGERLVITGRMGAWGQPANRPVRWSVGAYTK
ncbi:hypothetical protein [Nonomuraea sp. SBT364]|uniref:hypothetical protein n=1 Tax=Nonomuraea sp. SBT364 TaxID=1580530 RepID=UPI00066A6613|nr:hypothetical protein [Nonomuraea sp. SBT364]